MSSPPWPPLSIAVDTNAILDECESMEMAAETATQPFLAETQMAALLYQNNLVHARHVWRRFEQTALLQQWHQVLNHMENMNLNVVFELLDQIQQGHPAPLSTYAAEVATSFRQYLLKNFQTLPPDLGFATPEEQALFLQQVGWKPVDGTWKPGVKNTTLQTQGSLQQVVSFFETTRLNM